MKYDKQVILTLDNGTVIAGVYRKGFPGSWYYEEESSPNYIEILDKSYPNNRFDLTKEQEELLNFVT